MIRAVLLALAACVFATPALAQAGAKQIKGEWITLGDVAPVTGEAAGILLGAAPPAGQTLSLDPAFIVATAKSAGVLLAIPLDQPILVTRTTGNAPAANVARTANQARQIGTQPQDGGGEILVLVRDVPRGGVITEADLGWEKPRTKNMRGLDYDAVVGMEARRLLKAGNPVQMSDIKAAAVIRKGDPVSLVYLSNGVRLAVEGVAQNEAAPGEAVRVLNSYSKRTIDAVAHGPGEARVR